MQWTVSQTTFVLDISYDRTGNVYVADTDNHRVQVFTANDKYIQQFGKKAMSDGELYQPCGIAIESNTIYVSERLNHCVSLFTQEGDYLRLLILVEEQDSSMVQLVESSTLVQVFRHYC